MEEIVHSEGGMKRLTKIAVSSIMFKYYYFKRPGELLRPNLLNINHREQRETLTGNIPLKSSTREPGSPVSNVCKSYFQLPLLLETPQQFHSKAETALMLVLNDYNSYSRGVVPLARTREHAGGIGSRKTAQRKPL